MTRDEIQQLAQAVRRRTERIPARHETYLSYCRAVEAGLLSTEPKAEKPTRTLAELQSEIAAMQAEKMPIWRPEPDECTTRRLIALANVSDQEDESDSF